MTKSTLKPKPFNLSVLRPEKGIPVSLRTAGTSEMYAVLDVLRVDESYKMPMEMFRDFCSAKVSHKRKTNKVFIYRKLDKYNFRTWRIADGSVLKRNNKK